MLKVKHKEIPTKEQLIKQLKLAIGMLDDAAKLPTVGGKANMYKLTVLTSNEDSDLSIVKSNAVLKFDRKVELEEWYSDEASTILDRIADYEERDSEGGFYLLYELSMITDYLEVVSVDDLDSTTVPNLEAVEACNLDKFSLESLVYKDHNGNYTDTDVMDALLSLLQSGFTEGIYYPSWTVKDKVITLTNVGNPYAIEANELTFSDTVEYFKHRPNTQWFISLDFSEAIEGCVIWVNKITVEVKINGVVDKWKISSLTMFTYIIGLSDAIIPNILNRFTYSLENLVSNLIWLFINNNYDTLTSVYKYKNLDETTRVIDYLNLKHVARRNGNLKLIKGVS